MTIKKMILKHLLTGQKITPMIAMTKYDTMSLPFHVFALRQEGYNIQTELKITSQGKRYAEYSLIIESR